MHPFTPPGHGLKAFHCPHCNAFSDQIWSVSVSRVIPSPTGGGNLVIGTAATEIAECAHCHQFTIWVSEKLAYPTPIISEVAEPNSDLRDDIREDYQEAKAILDKSPRGAAALLRLGVQKLCNQLGEKGENINADIANLVKKGLPVRLQQALDIVRVIGNNAVHPGQIDLKDDAQTARELFDLINLVADVMITQPNKVDALYRSLPQTARDAVQKRDGTS